MSGFWYFLIALGSLATTGCDAGPRREPSVVVQPAEGQTGVIARDTKVGRVNSTSTTGLDDPEAFVRSVYDAYTTGEGTGLPPAALSSELKRLLEKRDAQSEGEDAGLSFDPWVNGQDFELSSVTVTSRPRAAGRRRIIVTFENMGERNVNYIDFVEERGRWYLADIRNDQPNAESEGWVLSKLLAE